MGKISISDTTAKQRHNPLHRDISTLGGNLRTPKLGKSARSQSTHPEEDGYLDASTSRKILQLAREQQEELEAEDGASEAGSGFATALRGQQSDSEAEESEDEDEEEYENFEEEYDYEEEVVDEADAALFEKYLQSQGGQEGPSFNLADKIMAKINEKETQKEAPTKPTGGVFLPPKVILAYEKIGQILSTYTHGKLPKLFKVLPTLKNWEDVLYVTNPEKWTPHAVYEATKLFVSNLHANEAQKFIENVLLERFRTLIEEAEDHSLNYHVYRAVKKSLYKPGAFFKGFLLPLVDSHCSVREATIVASVLAKVSVPALHSSVALSQLVQRDFKPSTTVFIRVLIEKKYALPYQTLDELVFYFMRFRNAAQGERVKEEDTLPVVWHKAFLAFSQRYKNDITDDQRDFLLETVRQRFHHAISPEIRRELLAGQPRVQEGVKEATMVDAF